MSNPHPCRRATAVRSFGVTPFTASTVGSSIQTSLIRTPVLESGKRTPLRATFLVAMMSAVAVFTIGCSGNDEPAPSTATPAPTATATVPPVPPTATVTTAPTIAATPTRTIEERQKVVTDFFTSATVLTAVEAQTVTVSRVANGRLELEYFTKWASKDSQPPVSYAIAQLVAGFTKSWTPEVAEVLLGPGAPGVQITTYSVSGNYRYQSFTDLPTLHKVADKSITYAEWVAAAGAAFK